MDAAPDISQAGVERSVAALDGRTSSEKVAEMAPGARLVKSISNMPMGWIQDFSPQKPKTVIFASGDDAEAKAIVIDLINSTGLVGFDLGGLHQAAPCSSSAAPYPPWNCTSSAGWFARRGRSALAGPRSARTRHPANRPHDGTTGVARCKADRARSKSNEMEAFQ